MFHLQTTFSPCGDQAAAIEKITQGIETQKKAQVLLGITGSGKTFTMANIIARCNRPTLILAHNKTLAAQLYQECRSFFPNNAVEYFVSYYDYYQPEAYIPRTDVYIEKDLAINDKIDKMRLSATRSLIEREDVIIVSSISCIYGLGMPEYYAQMALRLECGKIITRDEVLLHLVQMHYSRSDSDLARGNFRVRGDILEIVPAYEEDVAFRMEFFGDEIERISQIDPLTGKVRERKKEVTIFPGSHYVTPEDIREGAIHSIVEELEERREVFLKEKKYVEEQRIRERTLHDVEMIKEIGFCKGVENYSRHFSHRKIGEPPPCLLDYFPQDFLFFIDESHQTVPQMHAMYNGDRARKKALIDYGFRLPSAYDNRPLRFEEIYEKMRQVIYVSATPGIWEIEETKGVVVEQIIRPTYLLDPEILVKPAENQVDDVLEEIRKETSQNRRVLVTTLTKRLAEDLTKYLVELNVKAKYLHSDIDTLERMHIIKDLRLGHFDVLIGINLLREGLDIPEVSLVAILDADKEGFLRSETALVQTCGRASRNVHGRVVMYADKMTGSMEKAIAITNQRRQLQLQYNKEHHVKPKSVEKQHIASLEETFGFRADEVQDYKEESWKIDKIEKQIQLCKKKMQAAAKKLDFEEAAMWRDKMHYYQNIEMQKL